MSELKTLDKLSQFKMTNAIQKAASLALTSDKDRNQVIAEQLDKADVPKELTKLATCAFNRRLSVFTLAGRSDQNKAQSFPIANAQAVCKLRGIQDGLNKAASYKITAFDLTITTPTIYKTAAAQVTIPDCTVEQYLKKTQKLIDLGTIAYQEQNRELSSAKASLQHLIKSASQELRKDPLTSNKLATVYGDAFTNLFKDLPKQSLKKHAAYVMLPKNFAVELAQKAMLCNQGVMIKQANFQKMTHQLTKLAKYASEIQDTANKAILKGLLKKADGYSLLKDIAGNVVSAPVVSALGLMSGAGQQFNKQMKAFNQLNGTDRSFHPADALTPTLLTTDKYDDARQAIADVLADPSFKDTPTREIQQAVFGALRSMHQGYKPQMRQLLKAIVATRIAAGGRTNQAQLASIAQTEQTKEKTQSQAKSTSALQAVKSLSPVQQKHEGFSGLFEVPTMATLPQMFPHDLTKQIQDYAKKKEEQRTKLDSAVVDALQKEHEANQKLYNIKQMLRRPLLNSKLKNDPGFANRFTNTNIKLKALQHGGIKALQNNAIQFQKALADKDIDADIKTAIDTWKNNNPDHATQEQAVKAVAAAYGVKL